MPTFSYQTAIAATLVSLSLATPLAAQPLMGGMMRADTNGDGALSQTEAAEARRAMFSRLDRNADGQVSPDEMEAARNRIAAMARMLDSGIVLRSQALDTDGNGALTEAEFMAKNPVFEMMDRNGDGLASAEEIAAMRERIAARRP